MRSGVTESLTACRPPSTPSVQASKKQMKLCWRLGSRVSPILSGLSSLNETVEVPRPPDLVVTMISPLSSLAGPTRHTILLADIHSAVSMQLWPQIDRPETEGRDRTNKQTVAHTHSHTLIRPKVGGALSDSSDVYQQANCHQGSKFKLGSGWVWVALIFLRLAQLLIVNVCDSSALSGSLLAQRALCPYICQPRFNPPKNSLGTRRKRQGLRWRFQQRRFKALYACHQTLENPVRADQQIAHKTVNNMPITASFPASVLHRPLCLNT